MEPKKRSLAAGERDEFLRAAWRAMVAGDVDAERLVFVDEMGANVSLCPLYAWSRRGERASGSAPRNWRKNVTLLSSITADGIGPCLAVEDATTREVFEAYLEWVLAPTLRPGQTVVMDNLSAHKGGQVREIVEGRGVELLYLPPYSPDFNPIEGGLLEGQRAAQEGRGAHPRGADRRDGPGAGRRVRPRRTRVLRALRLPLGGPTAMTNALRRLGRGA